MLTQAQLTGFREHGFARMPDFIDADTVERLRSEYDRFLNRDIQARGDRMLGDLIRQVMFPAADSSYFRENPALERGRAVAKQILNTGDIEFFFDMLISKEPGQLNETPWHNDYAYAVTPPGRISKNRSLQFWVALDDVTVESGCMQFIPGSHNRPSPEHFVASGEPTDDRRLLATKDVDPSRAVACPVKAGGATVHATGTLHYTGGNHTSDRQRRAYIFNLRVRGTELIDAP